MTMPVRLLLNGKKAGLDAVRAAIRECRKCFDLDVRVTFEGGDIHRFVQEASAEGVSRIIAGGGDGTVKETVAALMALAKEQRPELGIMPLGTANDLASAAMIPEDLQEALTLAATGEVHWVDVAKANDHYFINVASGGFGAQVTTETPVALKNFLGGGAYTLSGLIQAVKFTPFPGTVKVNDTSEDMDVIVAAVCNGRQAGGGQLLAPQAFINDGLLDVVTINDFPVEAVSDVISELLDIQDKAQFEGRYVKRLQTESVIWHSKEAMPVNLDGEPITEKEITFSVCKAQISLVLPEKCPLLTS
ncbi:lipid kinase YegS [Thalassotalea litorea]|uniref:lipid kinase YegS n=1 Tax=Thalassotalea litorea TaxID=2020715 RepID=UPI00373500B2